MKQTNKTIFIFIFILINSLSAQNSEIYKNTCHVFDKNSEINETGFINLNDSVILTNYNDSVSVINIKKCVVIKRLNFKIHSNFNTDAGYEHQSPVVPMLRENNKIWLRLIYPDGNMWFGYLNQDLTFVKTCQINSAVCLFVKRENVFYAVVQDGEFVNNGSNVKIPMNSGLISFTEFGFLLNTKRVYNYENLNGGERLRPITYPILINDKNNIYFGTSVNCWGNPSSISNTIYFGTQKINCDQGGNQSLPYIILKMDTSFNLKSYFVFEGYARNIKQTSDSIIVFGSGGRVYIKDYGVVKSSVGMDYHYRLSIDKTYMKYWKICTIAGSGGSGGWFDPYYFPSNYYQSERNFNYITFKGTIYFDKPYASGGGQNIIFGFNKNNSCSELSNSLQINSQTDIWANLSFTPNLNFISISKAPDFWINNNRINRGNGIYYFALDTNGQVELSKINNSLYAKYIYTKNSQLKFSPNPTTGIVYLKNIENNSKLFIWDLLGNLVMERNILNVEKVDLSELNRGIYFIGDNLYHRDIVILH